MIIPDNIASAVATLLTTNAATLGIESAGEIGEEKPAAFQPPYIAFYIDTSGQSVAKLQGSNSMAVPFDLNLLVTSASLESIQDSSAQAWTIAFKAFKLITGTVITIDGSKFILKPHDQPFQIIQKTADSCVIKISLYFFLNKWD